MKKQRGITLIALVITIIVLLILAGVSISAIMGENGIIKRAEQARDKTRKSQIEEQIELYKTEREMAKITGDEYRSIDEFVNDLESSGIITSEEKEKIIANKEITIGDGGTIKFPYGKTLVDAFKDGEIKVGDYLDYTPSDLSAKVELSEIDTGYAGTQIYKVDDSTTWRVLGLNEDETELLLISGSSIKKDGDNPYLFMGGVEAWYNGVNTLNKISKIYHNNDLASETRSITLEDINNAVGVVAEGNLVYRKDDISKTDINIMATQSGEYVYKKGDFAPENYLKVKYPDNEKILGLSNKKIGDSLNTKGYVYVYGSDSLLGPTSLNLSKDSETWNVLFAGTDDTTNPKCMNKWYWIANQTNVVLSSESNNVAGFGPAGIAIGSVWGLGDTVYTDGQYLIASLGVRTIVSLKSDVTVDQIKPTTGEESVWDVDNTMFVEQGEYTYGFIE